MSRLERFLRLPPRGTEVVGSQQSGSTSAAGGEEGLEGLSSLLLLGMLERYAWGEEEVNSPELMWRYLELLFLPQDRRMAQLLREWLRGEDHQQPADVEGDDSEDVPMDEAYDHAPPLPELARAEQAMSQSTTMHYSWEWALEDAIAPKQQALGVYSKLGISPPRDLRELNKSFPRVQLAGPDHTFDVRATDRPMRTRRPPADPFAYSPLMPGFMTSHGCGLLQPPPPLPPEGPPLLPASSASSSSSSSSFPADAPPFALGATYVPPETGPTLFSEPVRARSRSRDSLESEPSKNSHRGQAGRGANSTFRQLYEDLKSTCTANRELGRYILRNIMANIDAEEERGQSTRGFIRTLSEAAASHVIRLEYDHWIDSVEELFPAPEEWPKYEGKIIVVFDDCSTKIRARAIERNVVIQYLRDRQERFMTGFDDIQQFSLTTRTLRSSDELSADAEDDISVPSHSGETLEGLPDLPQIGPFCHICRQSAKAVATAAAEAARKEALGLPPTSENPLLPLLSSVALQALSILMLGRDHGWRCAQESSTMPLRDDPARPPATDGFATRVWLCIAIKLPVEGKAWTCPVCTTSCSCERCTRAEYIKEIRAFALANLGAGRLRDLINRPVEEPREKWRPGSAVPWAQFARMAPNSSFIIQPDAEVYRQALEIESAFTRKGAAEGREGDEGVQLARYVDQGHPSPSTAQRLEAAEMLSKREDTLAVSLAGSGPQVLARSLLQPIPDWVPTDDLCIKDDDLADEFIMALRRVLPEKSACTIRP
ncbi:hypothetical protein FOZ60_016931 [Perkinsus olseni]|uniref:Uncharacterized protein n=1 Tax=Perkinsus olseni TaxID=32597 RepID=A0A7J6P3R2_PEROL|nr:hypothetical protein FOZ60_016931 [Perkinsus olseni]